MVSRTVWDTRETLDATGAGTAPWPTNASTPSRAASRSSLVGTLGRSGRSGSWRRPVIRAMSSLNSMVSIFTQPRATRQRRSVASVRRGAEIKGAAGDLWVLAFDPVEVLAGLSDLCL